MSVTFEPQPSDPRIQQPWRLPDSPFPRANTVSFRVDPHGTKYDGIQGASSIVVPTVSRVSLLPLDAVDSKYDGTTNMQRVGFNAPVESIFNGKKTERRRTPRSRGYARGKMYERPPRTDCAVLEIVSYSFFGSIPCLFSRIDNILVQIA